MDTTKKLAEAIKDEPREYNPVLKALIDLEEAARKVQAGEMDVQSINVERMAAREAIAASQPAPVSEKPSAHSDKNVQFADWMLHGIEISGEAADGFKLNAAVRDVLVERQRQVSIQGWTPEHDDEHRGGAMAVAAACYAIAGALADRPTSELVPTLWLWTGWSWEWWKPTSMPRRNLVKAGALILAEIERLDRAAAPTPSKGEA